MRLAKKFLCFCFQALDTLSTVAPLCLDDYMTCQSNTRLLMLLEWCVGEGKHCLIFLALYAYCSNRSDEGLTLETSAFLPFTVANLRFQLICEH